MAVCVDGTEERKTGILVFLPGKHWFVFVSSGMGTAVGNTTTDESGSSSGGDYRTTDRAV